MEAKLQLRVQRYGWDAAASSYEDEWCNQLALVQKSLLEISDLQQGLQVIETAAGTGLVTFPISSLVGQKGGVLATDLSSEMVLTGNNKVERLGISNVQFKRMNAEALKLDDNSFDRAICALGLMYMPEPKAALQEMRRVLKSGGRASVAIWGERKNCGWAEIFPIVDAHVKSEVCPLFFGHGAPRALVSTIESVGFIDVEEQRIEAVLTFESQERLLSAMIDGGAVALAAKRFSKETRQRVEQDFLDSVAVYRKGSYYEIPGEFVVASGIA